MRHAIQPFPTFWEALHRSKSAKVSAPASACMRCPLLSVSVAHLYAGCGVVADSDPAEELAETEVKLQALLPLLT